MTLRVGIVKSVATGSGYKGFIRSSCNQSNFLAYRASRSGMHPGFLGDAPKVLLPSIFD